MYLVQDKHSSIEKTLQPSESTGCHICLALASFPLIGFSATPSQGEFGEDQVNCTTLIPLSPCLGLRRHRHSFCTIALKVGAQTTVIGECTDSRGASTEETRRRIELHYLHLAVTYIEKREDIIPPIDRVGRGKVFECAQAQRRNLLDSFRRNTRVLLSI